MKKSMLIVSDTPIYKSEIGFHVFEPTLREIEEVSDLFSTVTWVSYLRAGIVNKNTRLPRLENIHIKPINDSRGGKSLLKKLKVLLSVPSQAITFYKEIQLVDVVHTRAPSVPALLVVIYSFFDRSRIYWHKYAGNWSEIDSPLAFKLQKWLLTKLDKPNIRITINGVWPGLHRGFISMENPCLNQKYMQELALQENARSYSGKLKICFVGALDPFKGATRLVTALLAEAIAPHIDSIWIVGDGAEMEPLMKMKTQASVPIHLCGYLSRQEIYKTIYTNCHILVLPSETEGFPKVVAEAASHACIPVVTAISAIDQYITSGVNGFLIENPSVEAIQRIFINEILKHQNLQQVSQQAFALAHLFTYERFKIRIAQEVLTVQPA
jgi:glycosyltransferase involved in cell wall biosynthesis